MAVTFSNLSSLHDLLRQRGVPKDEVGTAANQIAQHMGLGSAEDIKSGTLLQFPDQLVLRTSTLPLKKLMGDVASEAKAGQGPSGGRPMGTMGRFAFAETPKKVTANDVIHQPELGRTFGLYLEHLARFASEEIVGYARGMLDLLETDLPAKEARQLCVNVNFALNAMSERAPGMQSHKLLQASQRTFEIGQDATGPQKLSAGARDEIRSVIDAFAQTNKISQADSKLPAEAFEASREVNRFRPMVEGHTQELSRAWMPQYETQDFRQKLPNNLPSMKEALEKLALPDAKLA
ncbi:MAG: hypothetical protein ABIJ09_02460 [Pseudomonadota bacterium]